MRVLVLGLEDLLKRKISPTEAIVQFIPEYVAYLLNRLEVGRVGKTWYERTKGKMATVLGLEFGTPLRARMRGLVAKLKEEENSQLQNQPFSDLEPIKSAQDAFEDATKGI